MGRLMIVALCVSMSAGHVMADTDAVANAQTLCRAIDTTISLSPCTYSEEAKTVTVSVGTQGGDARELCQTIESSLMEKHIFFDGDPWKLNLKSSASGDNTIASCDLPQTPH
ncbi:hypothetical protein FHT86_006523 [Rhizobium sp. BK313]|uniref:hypothetical protein n=1 Tax=Rhizobium sp. BK313 TaxID=2587081 RepID=UPI00105F47D3|nr:hypothetical protein [Rhizobium sp. BK313]MBB3458198.1 hypothetical protein [Rhizobium sp. BK313]